MEDVGSEWTKRDVEIRYSDLGGSQITAGIEHDAHTVLDIHCIVWNLFEAILGLHGQSASTV